MSRRSSLLSGTADVPTADPRASGLPSAAALAGWSSPAAHHATTAVARSPLAAPTAAEAPVDAISASTGCATGTTAHTPFAGALHVSTPCEIATSATGAAEDANATTSQAAPVGFSADAAGTTQPGTITSAVPANVLLDSGAGGESEEPATAAQLAAVGRLAKLAQQIAQAVADAAIQLVKEAGKAEQWLHEQQHHGLQPHSLQQQEQHKQQRMQQLQLQQEKQKLQQQLQKQQLQRTHEDQQHQKLQQQQETQQLQQMKEKQQQQTQQLQQKQVKQQWQQQETQKLQQQQEKHKLQQQQQTQQKLQLQKEKQQQQKLQQEEQQQQKQTQQPQQQEEKQQQQQEKQQQQQQQQHQKQHRQQILTAASPMELLAALSADKSGVALAGCLAMTKPAAAPTQAPHPGFTLRPAVPMATDTPKAACFLRPASLSASASTPSAPPAAAAAAAMVLPPSSIQAQAGSATGSAIRSGGLAWPEAVKWPPQGAFPGLGQQHAPSVRLGPPVGLVPTKPVAMPPPPAAWPRPPARPFHSPLLYWGQPPPAQPVTQYRQVIAPPAPPPGPPPPQPASGTAALVPPPLPSVFPRLQARPQKRKAPAHQHRPAAKRQTPSGRRAPHREWRREDSGGSVGSVHSNSRSEGEDKDCPGSSSKKKSSPSGAVGLRLCKPHPVTTGIRPRPGKHGRRSLKHKARLAESAQEAYARASGKVIPDAPATPGGGQRDCGQLPKNKGKKGKGKGPSHKPAQTQKGRIGAPRGRFHAP